MNRTPEFPSAFGSADVYSLQGQRRTIRHTAARLLLIGVATLCLALAPLWALEVGDTYEIELIGVLAAVLFTLALLLEIRLLRTHPERNWYDGRAVAESTKTLAWRYAVGGEPYSKNGRATAVDFASDIAGLGTDVAALGPVLAKGGQPTAWMEEVRAEDLTYRRNVYLGQRVRAQQGWYTRKAEHNLTRAKFWKTVLLSAEVLGVFLALSKSLSLVPIDLASLAAAVIAGGTAWLAVKQHETLANAYTLASRELAAIHVRLLEVDEESVWAEEVGSAEEAISREHTMWRASRSRTDSTN